MLEETYITTLDEWRIGERIEEGRQYLQSQTEYGFVGDGQIGLARVRRKPLFVNEFEIEAPIPSRSVPVQDNEVISFEDVGEFVRQSHFSIFGGEYTFCDKKFLFLAGDNERCYAIQDTFRGTLIQWATHKHDDAKKEILLDAEHVVLREDMGPWLLPYAFIHGRDVLSLGDATKSVTGYYRELSRKS